MTEKKRAANEWTKTAACPSGLLVATPGCCCLGGWQLRNVQAQRTAVYAAKAPRRMLLQNLRKEKCCGGWSASGSMLNLMVPELAIAWNIIHIYTSNQWIEPWLVRVWQYLHLTVSKSKTVDHSMLHHSRVLQGTSACKQIVDKLPAPFRNQDTPCSIDSGNFVQVLANLGIRNDWHKWLTDKPASWPFCSWFRFANCHSAGCCLPTLSPVVASQLSVAGRGVKLVACSCLCTCVRNSSLFWHCEKACLLLVSILDSLCFKTLLPNHWLTKTSQIQPEKG